MATFTKDNAATALELLCDAAALRQQALDVFPIAPIPRDEDEMNDSDSPILDTFVAIDGEQAMIKMTNFSRQEFDRIYTKTSNCVTNSWNTGRGRKTSYRAKDVLFMTLSTLKTGGHWDYMASMFRITGSVFQRLIKKFFFLISEELYEGMVVGQRSKQTMNHFAATNKLFKNHPHALYATDIMFQHTNRPSGNHQESKFMFSAKHKLYGYKMEVSVFPSGFAACVSAHRAGSVSDLTIFREMYEFHKTATEKGMDQLTISDHGPLRGKYPNLLAILSDKGYQGAAEDLRVLYPKKGHTRC